MINDFQFLSENELRILTERKNNRELIVWGCGPTAEAVIRTLADMKIEVDYYGDSNEILAGQYKEGIRILSPKDMVDHMMAIVIIASFGYVPIYKMLLNIGVSEIYALRDVYKYPLEKMLRDQERLSPIFFNMEIGKKKHILVELYGNIGDTIVRIGIVKQIFKVYGKNNVFLLFADRKNAEIYQLLTNQVIILEEDDLNNDEIRFSKLEYIARLHFEKTFILCDTRIYAQRRILNRYNSYVEEEIYSDLLPEGEYLAGLDMEWMKNYLFWPKDLDLTGWNKLGKKDLQTIQNVRLPKSKYVAINLGASRRIRQMNPNQFIQVIHYIMGQGYQIALLGDGVDDEFIADVLINACGECGIVNYVSKYTIPESAKVILESAFFVGTESGMWNLSYILGKPSVVIYGGGDYGSFLHPNGIIEYVSVGEKKCFGCKWYCNSKDEYGRARCIYEITSGQIIAGIKHLEKRVKEIG